MDVNEIDRQQLLSFDVGELLEWPKAAVQETAVHQSSPAGGGSGLPRVTGRRFTSFIFRPRFFQELVAFGRGKGACDPAALTAA